MATLNTKIVLRNDIAENWELHNPKLLAGETGVETDTGYFKIGDGEHNWNDLPYANKFTSSPTAAHYEAIAKEAKAPIIMYSVASRTGCNIAPETAANFEGLVKEGFYETRRYIYGRLLPIQSRPRRLGSDPFV